MPCLEHFFSDRGGVHTLNITMPRFDGDFRQLIDKKPPSPYVIFKNLFTQVMTGVGHIHQARIVHRDLKPDNIMINHEGSHYQAVITDFGLSKELNTQFNTRGAGTLHYMAPEVFVRTTRPYAQYGFPADIFSCGAIGVELLHPEIYESASRRFMRLLNTAGCSSFITISGRESDVSFL